MTTQLQLKNISYNILCYLWGAELSYIVTIHNMSQATILYTRIYIPSYGDNEARKRVLLLVPRIVPV